MRSFAFALASLALIGGMWGCASSKAINPHDRAAIDSISVAKDVKMPNTPIVVGSEAGLGVLFGVAGSVAAASESQKAGGDFSEFLKANRIDVGSIVRQQFTDQVTGDPFYGPKLSQNGTYRYELDVTSYGIVKTNTFSSHWKPVLGVRYRLVSPDGKVLAESAAMTPMFSDLPTFTADEMKADPQLLRRAFDEAAREVMHKLLQT